MYENLASFAMAMPQEQISSLYLEDIALCATWYESHQENSEIAETYSSLRQVFDHWVRDVSPPKTDSEGYRQQPLIRDLLGELAEGHVARLERDELDLIYYAVGFARRSGKLDIFRRVLSCSAPYMNSIEQERRQKNVEADCPNLGKRLTVATLADIKSAEPRDVRTFGGLSIPIRGPVYIREGNLKVLSGIPADCTVVVDKGSCCVRGAVDGNLATTESCDILENISGVVIARRGGVNAKDILNHATVISKEDSVRAVSAEAPKIVFAAREINISGNATGGRYFSRLITFGGDVSGGELYATERATAQHFITTEERPLRVCLLRGLSCKDYGEVLTQESGTLLNSAMKLRQRLNHMEELTDIAEREADDYAGNILMYVLGEGDTKERIQHIQRRRRRLSVLDRLASGIRALVIAAEDRINRFSGGIEENGAPGDDQATLDDLRRELTTLANEGSIDPEIYELKEEVVYLGRKLQRRGMLIQGLEQVLDRLLERGDHIGTLIETLSKQLEQEENLIEQAMSRAALLERARAECSRVEMLKQLSMAARKLNTNDVFKQRLNDRQVKILQRTMETRMSRMAAYRATSREIHDRVEDIREKLWTEYMVSLPDHVLRGWAVGGARIDGNFSADVFVCPWRHFMDDPSTGGKSCVTTEYARDGSPKKFVLVRTERSTIEDLTPPETEVRPSGINV